MDLFYKIRKLFKNRKKRYLYMFLFMLPFLILIVIFGLRIYKEAKTLISLATGDNGVNLAYVIPEWNLTLREDATDVQFEYFTELKEAVEGGEASEEDIVGLVGKNYVADFYTWTNKQGQFDVGGMNYVCSEKNETIKYRENIYQKARDEFYKYINVYMSKYGKENLLEVENVTVDGCKKLDNIYTLHEYIDSTLLEDGETVQKNYGDVEHDCYEVRLAWVYKQNEKFDTRPFDNSIYLLVIENDGKYEIVEASKKEITLEESDNA